MSKKVTYPLKTETKKQRKKIYKYALSLLSNESSLEAYDLDITDCGLCLLLPCIQYNLKYDETPDILTGMKPFVEFSYYFDVENAKPIKYKTLYKKDTNTWRKRILKKIIKSI